MSNFAERLWDNLEPFQSEDTNGHLWLLCQAFGAMFQSVEDLSADTDDGHPGWTIILDIDRIPDAYLGFLAQFVGVRLKSGLDPVSQRSRVRSTDGWQRGRPASIIGAAQQHLTGNRTVLLRERDGSAWRYTVITWADETPDVAQTTVDLLEQKPGPDIMNHEVLAGEDWQQVMNNYATWQDVKTHFATWADVQNATPTA